MKRVCLVRLSAMGDVVQSLGAAQALLEAQPALEVHFVTQRMFAPLLEGLGFASVVAHDRNDGIRGLRHTRRSLRELEPDCVVDLQGNWKSAVVCRLSGGPLRIGAAGRHRRERSSAMLLNRRVAVDAPVHPAAIAIELLREIEPSIAPDARAHLVATEAEIEAAADAVHAAGLDASRPFSVLIVSSPADVRSWPIGAMQRQAESEPQPVLWLTGPDESSVELPGDVQSLRQGRGSLRGLVGLGALLERVGGRVLGPDTGPVHVLTAAGAAATVLFGPQDPVRTAPPGASVVTRADGPECVPCRRRRCAHPDGPVCMDFCVS